MKQSSSENVTPVSDLWYRRYFRRKSMWSLMLVLNEFVVVSSVEPSSTVPSVRLSTRPSTVPTSNTPSMSLSPPAIPSETNTSSTTLSVIPSLNPIPIPSIHPSSTLSSNPTRSCIDYDAFEDLWDGDNNGRRCWYYDKLPIVCDENSYYDKDIITPNVACCACGGGIGPMDKFPTQYPTDIPSFSPNFSHTPSVSLSPTAEPSLTATKTNSLEPTMPPTKSMIPTQLPSHFPSKIPTRRPTNSPSKTHSDNPTSRPSRGPTYYPSKLASTVPTNEPSDIPTNLPTKSPTTRPTVVPSSHEPSPSPTQNPSFVPSIIGTNAPSYVPSVHPTSLPSSSPSNRPSLYPSISLEPSSLPSIKPTGKPTFSSPPTTSSNPSSAPTISSMPTISIYQYRVDDVVMVIEGIDSVMSVEEVWQNVTASHISDYFSEIEFVKYVRVDVSLPQESKLLSETRQVESELPKIRLNFNVEVEYQSVVVLNVDRTIEDAFRSSNSKFVFIDRLNEKSTVFRKVTNLVSVTVPITGYNIPTLSPDLVDLIDSRSIENGGSLSENKTIGIIIGSTAGTILVVLLILIRHSRKSFEKNVVDMPIKKHVEQAIEEPVEKTMLSRIIEVKMNSSDSISHLEDPSIDPNFSHYTEEDIFSHFDSIATESIIPTFTSSGSVIYGNTSDNKSLCSALEAKPSNSSVDSLFIDKMNLGSIDGSKSSHSTRERDFEISVGPGKLGLVIDSPDSGPPVVHAIKASSALFGSMCVGDRIITFDDFDTTSFTAMQLTRIIAASFNKEERVFVVKRQVNNKPSKAVDSISHHYDFESQDSFHFDQNADSSEQDTNSNTSLP